jgi:hypothetical protein
MGSRRTENEGVLNVFSSGSQALYLVSHEEMSRESEMWIMPFNSPINTLVFELGRHSIPTLMGDFRGDNS